MKKHTPGPWTAMHICNNGWNVRGPAEPYAGSHDFIEPDACLMAASMDLLEVLETIENDNKQVPDWLWQRIQDVIKKARGE